MVDRRSMRRTVGLAFVLLVCAACGVLAIIWSSPEVIGDPPLTKADIARLQALYDESRVAPPDMKHQCPACDIALEARFKADPSLIQLAIAFEARPQDRTASADRHEVTGGSFARNLFEIAWSSTDDELLVELLSRVSYEDFGVVYLEFLLASRGGWKSDVSPLFEALDRCHGHEVREALIASIRRAFFRTIDHTLEDNAFVHEARVWYAANRERYKVNRAHDVASNEFWYGGMYADWLPPPFFIPADGPDRVEGEQLLPGSISDVSRDERHPHRWPRGRTWQSVTGE